MDRIYLDNNATTALDSRVLDAMIEDLASPPANPSSIHYFGQQARKKIANARLEIAQFLQVRPEELIFTSGATESLNALLRGMHSEYKGHIITSNIEHASVYETVKDLEKKGVKATFLSPAGTGAIDPAEVEAYIHPETSCLIFGAANTETGVKNDLKRLSEIAEQHRIPLIIDGVALLGKELFSIPQGVTAMAFSGHKLHGPKGIGLTFIRRSLRFPPLLTGGHQEFQKRAGTENVSGIVGLYRAIALLKEELPSATEHMRTLRDHFETEIRKQLSDVIINGEGAERIPNTSNLSFLGVDGETLLILLDQNGVAASHGSACASGAIEPSRVLKNMGLSKERAQSAIRFSLSRLTKRVEIDRTITLLTALVSSLRHSLTCSGK